MNGNVSVVHCLEGCQHGNQLEPYVRSGGKQTGMLEVPTCVVTMSFATWIFFGSVMPE